MSIWTPVGGDFLRLVTLPASYTNPRGVEAILDDDDNVKAIRAICDTSREPRRVTVRFNKRSTKISFERVTLMAPLEGVHDVKEGPGASCTENPLEAP